MIKNLKLEVIFSTYINSETDEILYKIPNEQLIDNIKKNGLENSKLEYALAYNYSYPNFDQYKVTRVELVKILSMENILEDGEDKFQINLEALEAFCHHKFDVEFGHDDNINIEIPKFVLIKDYEKLE